MKKLVLLRHGESIWNKQARFTGWADVDLTPKGIKEATEAGRTAIRNYYIGDPDAIKQATKAVADQLKQKT